MKPLLVAAGTALVGQLGPAGGWLPQLRPAAWRGVGRPDSLAVTFDDGPDPAGTPAILDELERLGWPATFFVLGRQVRRDPGLLREIASRGHEIGLHGDEHRYLIARSPTAVQADLARARDTVAAAVEAAVRWWRPPYGVMSGPGLMAARRLGLLPVLWTSWGRDWDAGATGSSILDTVSRRPLAGATVLLHDSDLMSAAGSWRATAAALPLLAGQAERRGLRPHRLSEHLGALRRDRTVDRAGAVGHPGR